MELDLVFLDFETTGLDPKLDKIIEVAALSISGDGKRETFNCFVDPGTAIPKHITRLTGIDDSMVKGAFSFQDLQDTLFTFIENKIIAAHNASFDISFLEESSGRRVPNICLDTLDFARLVYPNMNSYSLRHLARELVAGFSPSHRALDDVLALEGVFNALIEKTRSFPLHVIQEVHDALKQSGNGLAVLFEELLTERIRQYDFLQELKPTKKVPPPERNNKNVKRSIKWDMDMLESLFLPGGCVAAGLETYQIRTEQVNMAKAVFKAISRKRHLLIEAGTGVGKSMAYLVPAILWAVTQNEKVVVSTHTIALQEQLLNSEIKLLRENWEISFNAAVLKGRSNYLCLEKYRAAQTPGMKTNWTDKFFMARLAVWLAANDSGDKDSLHMRENEAELYSELASTAETCLGGLCRYFEECFYQKAKKKAQEAELIIVNHSLLLADLKIGGTILPKHQYLIIDEAHHLEEEGARHFSEIFSLKEYRKRLQQIQRRNDILSRAGARGAESCLAKIKNTINEIYSYLIKNQAIETVRIHEKSKQQQWWSDINLLFDNLMFGTSEFLTLLDTVQEHLTNNNEQDDDDNSLKEFRLFVAKLRADYDLVTRFFSTRQQGTDDVYWLEREGYGNDLRLNITPLTIATIFYDHLFSAKEAIVLTSATLSVEESFNFLIEQLGIPEELVDTARIPSPFFYDEQSLLLIDSSLPDPVKTSEEGYSLALAEALEVLLKATGGNTLVLFTSHKQLRCVFDLLFEPLQRAGLELYADGVNGRRNTLIGELKSNPKAIVFGSGMYWEGIDLPGQSLTSLFIVKLPFLPPNMPLIEAKTEKLAQNGKNGFINLSLPQAVLKFRQGYGRLIRTVEDCGIVVVMDNRLLTKRYGKSFIHSLPNERYFAGDTNAVAAKAEQWFKKMKIKTES